MLVKKCLKLAKEQKISEVPAVTDKVKFFNNLGFSRGLAVNFHDYPPIKYHILATGLGSEPK